MPSSTACILGTAVLNTPIGRVSVSACEQGIHNVSLTAAQVLPTNNNSISVTVVETPSQWTTPLKTCIDWLKVYFKDPQLANQAPRPPLHLANPRSDTFTAKVWDTLSTQVPCGKTVTYGELATMAGNNKAPRAVGGAMRLNQVPLLVPCHRVTQSGGKLGNFMSGQGIVLKEWLLKHEGAI
ncbi:methylated-DNA--protein-cysteine methyltransferase-like [Amphiura filiformis]|uniref:methylated-DNA--protein-cysteine methyltransferase-like n=1 Tax=Amphiura filiformis TaxID=82378 RepID=UPI003B217099